MMSSVVTASTVPAVRAVTHSAYPGCSSRLVPVGVLVLDALRRRRAGDRAEVLALEVLGAGDRVVVRGDQEVLAGDEVRSGEGDDLLALVGDRVGREDHVDLAVLQQRLALGGRRLDPLDLVLAVARARRRRTSRRRRRSPVYSLPSLKPRPGWSNLMPILMVPSAPPLLSVASLVAPASASVVAVAARTAGERRAWLPRRAPVTSRPRAHRVFPFVWCAVSVRSSVRVLGLSG